MGLYFIAKYLYDYLKVEIALTNERIIGKIPRLLVAFSLQAVDLPLSDIKKVSHTDYLGGGSNSSGSLVAEFIAAIIAGLIALLANYGKVVVVDRDGRKTKFRMVAAPAELDRQISQAAGIGEAAAPKPAAGAASGPAAEGLAERTLGRYRDWKPLSVLLVVLLLLGLALWYADVRLVPWAGKKLAEVLAPKTPSQTSSSQPSPPKTSTSKTPPTAADYVQQGLREKEARQKISLFTKALEMDPKNAPAFFHRGGAYQAAKDYDLALRDLDQAITLQPDYAVAYNQRGNVYYDRKQYDRALADYSRAIALKPDYSTAYANRGSTYYEQKNYDLAIADYNQAIALKADNPNAYNLRGNAYFRKKDYDRAVNDYHRATDLNPKFAVAFANRGNAFFEKKDNVRALEDYDRTIALKPDYAWAYYRRAVIYNFRGDAEQARRDYDKARSLNPRLPELVIK